MGYYRNGLSTIVFLISVILASGLLFVGCLCSPPTHAQGTTPATISLPVTSPHMALGNPDKATPVASNPDHYLMVRPLLCESYCNRWREPRWVSWKLVAGDIGTAERTPTFSPDTTLPPGFVRTVPSDYTNAGFDRGHMCPSKDRSDTPASNQQVFLMTNLVPQLHTLNAGPWERFEQYCRDQAAAGNDLYVVCGPVIPAKAKTIGRSGIAVPSATWKVVVIVPHGQQIGAGDRVIAVLMPNDSSVTLTTDWHRYRTTPQTIETVTGLRFFDALAPSLAQSFESRLDITP